MSEIGQFETKAEHADWLETTERSVDNWRKQPNGLPYTTKGRTPLFCREWTLNGSRLGASRTTPSPSVGVRPDARAGAPGLPGPGRGGSICSEGR